MIDPAYTHMIRFMSQLSRKDQCWMENRLRKILAQGLPKDIGYLLWKQRWYTICTIHKKYEPYCIDCHLGAYQYVWGVKIGRIWQKTISSIRKLYP